jgi:hypothetical protein
MVHAGEPNNVTPETCELQGTVRIVERPDGMSRQGA